MNGLVLCGGKSSRMGLDKAELAYHQLPQYKHIYSLLKPYCDKVFISSKHKNYDLPTLLDNPTFGDIGPIVGLLTAFDYQQTDWLIMAVDYPLLNDLGIKKLLQSKGKLASIYFNPKTNFFEPFIGLYRENFKPILFESYQNGNTSIQRILKANDISKIIPENLEYIRSINTYEEYMEIKQKLNSIG